MRPTALAAGPLVPTVDSQRPLAPCHDASTGTKLSQHATLAAPTGTKLSQHARNTSFRRILRQQGELCTASTTTKPSRANFLPHTEPPTVQNSPSMQPRRAIPVQNSPGTRPRRPTRYKTLPARNPRGPNRYKTLPACPKYLFSVHFAPAGRTLYRFHHHQAEQGEFSTAYGTTYGTKLSRHAPPAGDTGTKLSRHAPPAAHPVQNSPSTPETPLFGAFCASRENFVPLPPPPSRAGRKKSRTGRAKRGGASPYNPRNALIAGISRTAWTRPAR